MNRTPFKKRVVSSFVAVTLLVAGLTGTTSFIMPTVAQAAGNTPIFRLLNPTTGEHLYTADVNEATVNVATGGWLSEGIGWFAPPIGQGRPVYRLGAIPGSGAVGHLYTTSMMEREKALASKNPQGQPYWVCETGAGMYPCVGWFSDGPNSVYRQFYPLPGTSLGQHNYTDDLHEIEVITTTGGWVKEGLVGGVMKPAWLGMAKGVPDDQTVTNSVNDYLAAFRSTNCQSAGPGPSLAIATLVVSANVNLTGSGSGYQGKVMMTDGPSAVSFGIQYDSKSIGGRAYSNQPAFLSENVGTGVGSYVYQPWCFGALGRDIPVKLAFFADAQIVAFYVGNVFIGAQHTFMGSGARAAVEVDVKHNGDSVNATISNVTTGSLGSYETGYFIVAQTGQGLSIEKSPASTAQNLIVIGSGTATGFGPGQDWDASPGAAAAIAFV